MDDKLFNRNPRVRMTGEPHKIIGNLKTIALIGAVVALLLSIRQCSTNAESYADSKNYLASLNDTIRYLKNDIAQKPAVEVNGDLFVSIVRERDDLRAALAEAKLKAKNVRSLTQVVTRIETDTITIAFHDTLPCPDFVPVAFAVDSQYYNIAGMVGKSAISITKVDFPDSLYVITANKNHLFRKNEFLVSVQLRLPCVHFLLLLFYWQHPGN